MGSGPTAFLLAAMLTAAAFAVIKTLPVATTVAESVNRVAASPLRAIGGR
jgi:uncharacterized protein (DUF1786 family)